MSYSHNYNLTIYIIQVNILNQEKTSKFTIAQNLNTLHPPLLLGGGGKGNTAEQVTVEIHSLNKPIYSTSTQIL